MKKKARKYASLGNNLFISMQEGYDYIQQLNEQVNKQIDMPIPMPH